MERGNSGTKTENACLNAFKNSAKNLVVVVKMIRLMCDTQNYEKCFKNINRRMCEF